MGEFMQEQSDEEQDRRDQRSDPDQAWAPARVYLTKVLAEGERDQGSDNEPAVVKSDLYAGDCSELDVGAHARPSFVFCLLQALAVLLLETDLIYRQVSAPRLI